MVDKIEVSGPGRFTKRPDLSRATQIESMSTGKYGERRDLRSLRQGATTDIPEVKVSPPDVPENTQPSTQGVGAFEPTRRPDEPVTAGVDYGTPGDGSESNFAPMDGPDPAAILVRAMYYNNPTPQMRRLFEAFYDEGR